jgi:hypothetical protein
LMVARLGGVMPLLRSSSPSYPFLRQPSPHRRPITCSHAPSVLSASVKVVRRLHVAVSQCSMTDLAAIAAHNLAGPQGRAASLVKDKLLAAYVCLATPSQPTALAAPAGPQPLAMPPTPGRPLASPSADAPLPLAALTVAGVPLHGGFDLQSPPSSTRRGRTSPMPSSGEAALGKLPGSAREDAAQHAGAAAARVPPCSLLAPGTVN